MSVLERLLPSVGEMIVDRYELKEEIGRGGFGVVYRAWQTGLEEDVAIKILLPHVLENDDILRRFEQEVVVAKGLRHPNSIRLLDFARTDKGLPFYVMEFVRGDPLDKVISGAGRLSAKRTQTILNQVLKSLGEAHSKGVVHRDLKPANLMLTEIYGESNFVKVLDFGIAKALGGDNALHQTSTGMVLGTPAYMSPEQALGKRDLDGRSDIYALGLIMAECISGRPVVSGETPYLVVATHASKTPLVFSFEVVNSPLWGIIAGATAKDRDARFQNADAMRTALDQLTNLPDEVGSIPVDGPGYQPPPSLPGITPASQQFGHSGPVLAPNSGVVTQGGAPSAISGTNSPAVIIGDVSHHNAQTAYGAMASGTVPEYRPASAGRKFAISLVILLLLGGGIIFLTTLEGDDSPSGDETQPVALGTDNPDQQEPAGNGQSNTEPVAAQETDPQTEPSEGSGHVVVVEEELHVELQPGVDPNVQIAFAIASERLARNIPDVHLISFDGMNGVTVELNGQELGETPLALALPRVDEELEFEFHRRGYRSSSQLVSLMNSSVSIDLRRDRPNPEPEQEDEEEETTSTEDDEEETSTSPFGGAQIRD